MRAVLQKEKSVPYIFSLRSEVSYDRYLSSSDASQADLHVRVAGLLAEAPSGVRLDVDLARRELGVVTHRAAPTEAVDKKESCSPRCTPSSYSLSYIP